MQSTFFVVTALIQLAVGIPVDSIGASESPGTLSGNAIQLPIVAPINLCGNSIDVIGILNPTFGNSCSNYINGLNSDVDAEDTTADDAAFDPATDAASDPTDATA